MHKNNYSITGGDDYYKHESFNITIPTYQNGTLLNISISDDNVFEGNESFSITVKSFTQPNRVLGKTVMITIVDDDSELHTYVHIMYYISINSKPTILFLHLYAYYVACMCNSLQKLNIFNCNYGAAAKHYNSCCSTLQSVLYKTTLHALQNN